MRCVNLQGTTIPDYAQYLSVNQQYNVKKHSKFP